MLDKNVLSQLSQLKKTIEDSKEYGEGTVVGSNGRFGFVKLDDGRDAFLNPDKMQKVLPGDKVRVLLTKNDKDQLEATVEKIREKSLKRFVGQYKIKGNNHFVLPQAHNFSRWLYLPPQARQKCEENDWVLAELTRHPEEDGKASAKVIACIGKESAPYFEHNFIIAKHKLYRYWSKDVNAQVKEVTTASQNLDTREQMLDIPYVTIDAQETKDMDDAIYARTTDSGWQLFVAIADPASFISPSSILAKTARDYGQTVYLPGEVLPMLPEKLSTEAFSLQENKKRPALVCTMTVANNGDISDYSFKYACVQSKHKLSYKQVAAFINNDADLPCDEQIKTSLTCLHAISLKRNEYRSANNLMHEDQLDHGMQLNEQGKIESLYRRERNIAHKLVEEMMLATNLCAAHLLSEAKAGVFSAHGGFRDERLGEVRALLKEELAEELPEDIISLEGFVSLHKQLESSEQHRHLISPLRRMMQNTELSRQASPHKLQGFKQYVNITSPIRRYTDLSNHWSIQQILSDKKPQSASEKAVTRLNEVLSDGRIAKRELEQWLRSQYLLDKIGLEAKAVIRVVTQQGFGVKLIENGLEGFISFNKNEIQGFDAKRMTITRNDTTYKLDMEVDIRVKSVDIKNRRAAFELVSQTVEETVLDEQSVV